MSFVRTRDSGDSTEGSRRSDKRCVHTRDIDHKENDPAALHVPQKRVPKAAVLRRAGCKTRDVRHGDALVVCIPCDGGPILC